MLRDAVFLVLGMLAVLVIITLWIIVEELIRQQKIRRFYEHMDRENARQKLIDKQKDIISDYKNHTHTERDDAHDLIRMLERRQEASRVFFRRENR